MKILLKNSLPRTASADQIHNSAAIRMRSVHNSNHSRIFGIVVSAIVIMTCLLSQHARESFSAWRMGGIYLGNQGVRIQTGINNCGPTSLQMIFDYYGIPSTVQEIEQTIRLNEKGSTMLALKEMSEMKGLHAEGWRLTPNDISNVLFPALLFVHDDHFVVADSIWNDNVFVRDPAIGRLKIPKGKLTQIWKGEILLFKRK